MGVPLPAHGAGGAAAGVWRSCGGGPWGDALLHSWHSSRAVLLGPRTWPGLCEGHPAVGRGVETRI